ncbi:outer membrane beta-barrel protein [Marivirga sp.]|uniref:outer membrane beta-barrel protein n=1 Tax=Marivirga sp. TaxID=2018662 RepID=UPI0025FB46A4|nr:outer membrane beta-barrel protein [Marivirga sp.]
MKNIFLQKKKLLIMVTLFLMGSVAQAQLSGISIEASQQFSNFSYQNSDGLGGKSFLGSDEYTGIYAGGYNLGYRMTTLDNIVIRASIGMRRAGASLVFEDIVNTWSFQYADFRAAAGYEYGLGDKLGIYLTAGPYAAYLLRASQTRNDVDYNLKENGEINTWDFGIVASPGVKYQVSDFIDVYAEADYLFGLKNLETNAADTGQESYNVGLAISLGVVFIIE